MNDQCIELWSLSKNEHATLEVNENGVFVNNSPVVTEATLKTLIDDVISTREENNLLKRFSKDLLERLYNEG